MTKPDQDAIN